jgi:serine/threonine-protein kinase
MGSSEPFTLGSQVGRYTLEAVVGQGGMGVVYRAFDSDLQRRVAVKVMTPHLTSATALGRFQREAAAVAQLRHPGIAAVFDFGRHDTQPFIVFEWIDGRGLSTVLEEAKQLPLSRALRLTAQLASALDYAHQRGILHRDLKPSNVLVTPDDTPIIIDFGLAWLAGENTLTMPGALFGTPRYMSPEQFRGEMLDARADLYSLAVMAYEMIAGRPPFLGETIQSLYHQHLYAPPRRITEFRPETPKSIATALDRALAKDAAMRFVSGAAFSAALRDVPAPPEPQATDTMAQTVPVMAVPSTRPPVSEPRPAVAGSAAPEAGAVTVPDGAPPKQPAPSRGNRGLVGVVVGLGLLFCVVWSAALAMLWPSLTTRPTARPPSQAVAVVQPTITPVALPAEWTATNTPPSAGPTATRTAAGAPTQTPLIVTIVVTNVVVVNLTATSAPTGSPTITPTATRTATTAPGQPSDTPPPPTATVTPIPSATNAPASSNTPANTNSPTPTRSATPPPPTATLAAPPTATFTSSPTATFTFTPSATSTTGCAITGGALAINGNELAWPLTNAGANTATITAIDLNWPDTPPPQRLSEVFVGGTRISNSKDNQPPSALPAEVPWVDGAARSLAPGATEALRFLFRDPLPATGFSVSVTFDNGCALNVSN